MTYTDIETALKTKIDAGNWTVVSDGITAACYIWAESEDINLDLDNPNNWNTTANKVILVIHPSSRSRLAESAGSNIFSWIGDLKVYALTVANLKSAYTKLESIANSAYNLHFHIPGVNGDPKRKKYNSVIIYRWDKSVAN